MASEHWVYRSVYWLDRHRSTPTGIVQVMRVRERLTAATATLMQRQGVAGTGIAEILSTSGVTRRSIYLNFPGGKAELVAAATRAAGDELSTTLRDCIEQRDPIAAFTRVWSEILISTDFRRWLPHRGGRIQSRRGPRGRQHRRRCVRRVGSAARRTGSVKMASIVLQPSHCRRQSSPHSKGGHTFPRRAVDQAADAGRPSPQRTHFPHRPS
jgi:Transcriptional regulator